MDNQVVVSGSTAKKLEAAVDLAHLSGRPLFALAAEPEPPLRFRNLFGGRDSTLVQKFNSPPVLRHAGFSLEHDGQSKIVLGELRRVLIPSWKIMELWRDGTLIYAIDAMVQPFWGSPRPPDGTIQMNPLALAEPVYLFSELSRLVYEESSPKPAPARVNYRIRLDGLIQGETRASLCAGPLRPFFFAVGNSPHYAPRTTIDRAIVWEDMEINAGAIAYQLVQEVYHWFGISDDGIPYTRNDAGFTVIDPQALITAGRA